jgi:hypothetical protein
MMTVICNQLIVNHNIKALIESILNQGFYIVHFLNCTNESNTMLIL